MDDVKSVIRAILGEHAKLCLDLARLGDGDDLLAAGLTSMSTVTVMLALEDAFETEFPESMLNRRTFTSIDTIHEALVELSVLS